MFLPIRSLLHEDGPVDVALARAALDNGSVPTTLEDWPWLIDDLLGRQRLTHPPWQVRCLLPDPERYCPWWQDPPVDIQHVRIEEREEEEYQEMRDLLGYQEMLRERVESGMGIYDEQGRLPPIPPSLIGTYTGHVLEQVLRGEEPEPDRIARERMEALHQKPWERDDWWHLYGEQGVEGAEGDGKEEAVGEGVHLTEEDFANDMPEEAPWDEEEEKELLRRGEAVLARMEEEERQARLRGELPPEEEGGVIDFSFDGEKPRGPNDGVSAMDLDPEQLQQDEVIVVSDDEGGASPQPSTPPSMVKGHMMQHQQQWQQQSPGQSPPQQQQQDEVIVVSDDDDGGSSPQASTPPSMVKGGKTQHQQLWQQQSPEPSRSQQQHQQQAEFEEQLPVDGFEGSGDVPNVVSGEVMAPEPVTEEQLQWQEEAVADGQLGLYDDVGLPQESRAVAAAADQMGRVHGILEEGDEDPYGYSEGVVVAPAAREGPRPKGRLTDSSYLTYCDAEGMPIARPRRQVRGPLVLPAELGERLHPEIPGDEYEPDLIPEEEQEYKEENPYGWDSDLEWATDDDEGGVRMRLSLGGSSEEGEEGEGWEEEAEEGSEGRDEDSTFDEESEEPAEKEGQEEDGGQDGMQVVQADLTMEDMLY